MVSRMNRFAGFEEEAPKVIERRDASKRFCRANLLFSQENIYRCGLTARAP